MRKKHLSRLHSDFVIGTDHPVHNLTPLFARSFQFRQIRDLDQLNGIGEIFAFLSDQLPPSSGSAQKVELVSRSAYSEPV